MSTKIEIGGMRNMEGWLSLDNRSESNFNIITDEIPVPDESVEYFYMSHVIEHIPISCAESVFRKIFNKTIQGGKLRIVCPDLEVILRAYFEKDTRVFNNPAYQLGTVPYDYSRLGLGGCVVGQISTSIVNDENDSYLFVRKSPHTLQYITTFSHVSGWDFEMLNNLLRICGFSKIERTSLEGIDPHKLLGQLCVNAYK